MFPFDEEIEFILGRPNFWCASVILPALRRSDKNIPKKAEAEQAAAIYWMLQMYEKYGKEWKDKGSEELYEMFVSNKSEETKNAENSQM